MPRPTPLSAPATLLLLAATATTSPFAVAQDGQSTFGHARARELAELGLLPSARDVVVRDLLNYHRHRLPLPTAGQDLALDLRFDRASARPGDELWLQVGYTTAPLGDRALAPACAVALVVDCSGSMAEANKMTAVQQGLHAFVDRLRSDDEVTLVTFASEAQICAPRQRRGDGRWLHTAIDQLQPGGNTNLHAGLMRGLDELGRGDGPSQRRMLVLTDGIANRGVTDADAIVAAVQPLASPSRGGALDIAAIGVGQDLDVPLLQRLAAGARGLFHFVADPQDVQKVFVREADSLVAPVARSVRLRIELPHGLAVQQVPHEGVVVHGRRLDVELPDLNAGVTGVVLVRCRRTDSGEAPDAARAELRFDSVRTAGASQLTANAELPTATSRSDVGAAIDVEVRKNAAIAGLAQGLADMAAAADGKRWADADRTLRLAVADAQRLFPGQDDDVQRVRTIADGHLTTLRRYVDRFREL